MDREPIQIGADPIWRHLSEETQRRVQMFSLGMYEVPFGRVSDEETEIHQIIDRDNLQKALEWVNHSVHNHNDSSLTHPASRLVKDLFMEQARKLVANARE